MSKTREEKIENVTKLTQALEEAKGVALVSFKGLSVKDATILRRRCRAVGVSYFVVKKTLLSLALAKAGVKDVKPRELEGNIAAVFGTTDEVAAAKVVHDFMADHASLKFVGGLATNSLGWHFLTAREVSALAALPNREQLLGQLVGTIAGPLRGLVNVLSGNLRSFVQVLKAIEQAKA